MENNNIKDELPKGVKKIKPSNGTYNDDNKVIFSEGEAPMMRVKNQ